MLKGNKLYAGSNLKDAEDKDVTFDRTSGKTQTYTIEFEETPALKLQMCINCIVPNQYGGGHSTMRYKPLTVENNKATFTVDVNECTVKGNENEKKGNDWVAKQELKDQPENVTSIVLQMCDTEATYPATISIKKITRVISDPTGVQKIEVLNPANAEFVNAAGQKVGKNYKGLVINKATGKKYINK